VTFGPSRSGTRCPPSRAWSPLCWPPWWSCSSPSGCGAWRPARGPPA